MRPAVFSDHAERLRLIDDLEEPPGLVVLGSSRALKAEPAYLQQLTGLTGFNAAAANGKTEDGFAYANLFHDRWPDAPIQYLWILEVEAFRPLPPSPQLLAEPELARHFPASLRASTRLDDFQRLFEWRTAKASAKTVWRAARGAPQEGAVVELAPDGFRTVDQHDRSEAAGVLVRRAAGRVGGDGQGVRPRDAADGSRARGARLLRAGRGRHERGWGESP